MESVISSFADLLDGHDAKKSGIALVKHGEILSPPHLGAPNNETTEPAQNGQEQEERDTATRRARRTTRRRLMKAMKGKRRDNAALAAGSRAVLTMYEHAPEAFSMYQPKDGEVQSFRRVLGCGTLLGSVTPAIRTSETKSVIHGGLTHCGSVWACPECAAKIQTRRAGENLTAIKWALAQGYHVSMMTLTATHNQSERLTGLMKRFVSAYARLGRSKTMKRVREGVGYIGCIRAMEMTYGHSGWHYHAHVLYITENESMKAFQADLRDAWLRALESEHVFDSGDERAARAARDHAFHVEDMFANGVDESQCVSVADYLAKAASDWEAGLFDEDAIREGREKGLAAETAMMNTKLGKSSNRTPFQLLRDAILVNPDDRDRDAEYMRDAALFIEYALATKGKKQIFWSKGLKKMVGITDVSDEKLVEETEENGAIIYGLTREHWRVLRRDGWVGEYLRDVASQGSRAVTQAYFDTMFPADRLPRVLDARTTRRIWEAEKAARQAAAARYRAGRDMVLTADEKRAVFIDAHPYSREAEQARNAARQRAAAARLQNKRRSTGVEYLHQTSLGFAFDEALEKAVE